LIELGENLALYGMSPVLPRDWITSEVQRMRRYPIARDRAANAKGVDHRPLVDEPLAQRVVEHPETRHLTVADDEHHQPGQRHVHGVPQLLDG
jgi:hypothetical protein